MIGDRRRGGGKDLKGRPRRSGQERGGRGRAEGPSPAQPRPAKLSQQQASNKQSRQSKQSKPASKARRAMHSKAMRSKNKTANQASN